MTPVFQTKLPPAYLTGNCLAAAIASVLDLDITEVPNVEVIQRVPGVLWWNALQEWLWHVHGWQLLQDVRVGTHREWQADVPYLVTGDVGGIYHVCIMANNRLVHDPTPTGAGLDTMEVFYYFGRFVNHDEDDEYVLPLRLENISYSTVPQVADY